MKYLRRFNESNLIINDLQLQTILDKWGINCKISKIMDMWSKPHRYYHNLEHLDDMLEQINSLDIQGEDYDKLIISALFHDIIYDPMRKDNEERSAEYFIDCCSEINDDIKI